MLISEIFESIQGEGRYAGEPSLFIRTSGCNLRCRWCDTPHTSWKPIGRVLSVGDILSETAPLNHIQHVVVTGGEPLLQSDMPALLDGLNNQGRTITVETSGTHHQAGLAVDLYSLSPKLGNSLPGLTQAGARRIHLRNNNLAALSGYVAGSDDYQLKFVVCGPEDIQEIEDLVRRFSIPPDRVYLMPEGTTSEALRKKASIVTRLCKDHGFRFSDRLQIHRWGNRPGT